jgi:DNA-binding NarL/FixJ family response regulator
MRTPSLRALIVEDHEGFRRFLRLALEEMSQFESIGQARDGLEALQKAEELQPDLVLLDLALPSLNGFEVARGIRALCKESRILFVSQESSSDVAQSALRIGAHGYLLKSDAADLRLAVDTIFQGRTFLSSGLNGHTSVVPRRIRSSH